MKKNNKRGILLMYHDESCFMVGESVARALSMERIGTLPAKYGRGKPVMVSDFISIVDGPLRSQKEMARMTMTPGVNDDGWWNHKHLVDQLTKKAIPIFDDKYNDYVALFMFDHSAAHHAIAPDALDVH